MIELIDRKVRDILDDPYRFKPLRKPLQNKRRVFESALTYGDWDINKNWLKYKEEFMRGVNDE
ncbi:MAG: hypothetical protein MRK02_06270 [Candidatus Scalindua sp.]|nr:hypothetical protein [Candidatus Scalindua sp.]